MSLVLILVKFYLIIILFFKKNHIFARISLRCFLSANIFVCEEERERKKKRIKNENPTLYFSTPGRF